MSCMSGGKLAGKNYSLTGLENLVSSDAGRALRAAMQGALDSPDYNAGRATFEAKALGRLPLHSDYGAPQLSLSTPQMVVCPKGHEVRRRISSGLVGEDRNAAIAILDKLRTNHLNPTDQWNLMLQATAYYTIAVDGEAALQSPELRVARLRDVQSYVNHEEALRMVLGGNDSPNFDQSEQVVPYTAISESKAAFSEHDVVITVGGDNQFLGVFHKLQSLKARPLKEYLFLPLNSDYEFSRGALTSAPAVFWPIIQRKLQQGSYREVRIPLLTVYSEVVNQDGSPTLKALGHALTEVLVGARQRERITKCRVQKYSGDFSSSQTYSFDEDQEGSGLLIVNSFGATGWFLDADGKKLSWLKKDGEFVYPHSCSPTTNLYMLHTECGKGEHARAIIRPGETLRIVNLSHGESDISLDSGPEGRDKAIRGGLALHVRLSGFYVRVIRFNDWLEDDSARAFFAKNRVDITR